MKIENKIYVLNILMKSKLVSALIINISNFIKSLYKYVPGTIIQCNIDMLECKPFGKRTFVPIASTPSYLSFYTKTSYYCYLNNLKLNKTFVNYYVNKFDNLKNTEYLDDDNRNNYVLVYKKKNRMIIVDGIHRCSILRHNGIRFIRAKRINYFWFKIITLIIGW